MTNEQRIVKLRAAIYLLERVDFLQQEALDPNECREFFDQIQSMIEEFEDKIQQWEGGMVSASNLAYLSDVPLDDLNAIAQTSGYDDCKFITAKFMGLTKDGQFCYAVTFVENGIVQNGKVFLAQARRGVTTLEF